jgi:carbamate kinase
MKMLIALGGNAILKESEKGTFDEQKHNIRYTAKRIAEIIKKGHSVVITHGNGPQVGEILLRYELSREKLPVMPLPVCGAESQGMMGYMIEELLDAELCKLGIKKGVVCLITRTVVDRKDPHFRKPSKPIGPFYSKAEAFKMAHEYGWKLVEESGRYRRVVPSPMPIDIVELDAIRRLSSEGKVVICCGGGGVPVVRNRKGLEGAGAVIDKDFASSLLARKLQADRFIVLTDVESVFLDYGKLTQRKLTTATASQLRRWVLEDQFEEGTMKPKIIAAADFAEETGKVAIIAALKDLKMAVNGKRGTVITP